MTGNSDSDEDVHQQMARCIENAFGPADEMDHNFTSFDSIDRNLVTQNKQGLTYVHRWSVTWVWGEDERGLFLEVLTEHPHPGLSAARFHSNGEREPIETPADGFISSPSDTRESVAAREQEFYRNNRRLYANLTQRGLSPSNGSDSAREYQIPWSLDEFGYPNQQQAGQ